MNNVRELSSRRGCRFVSPGAFCVLAGATLTTLLAVTAAQAEGPIDFRRDIRPLLSEACFHCHGPDASTREADLRLDLAESAAAVTRHEGDSLGELARRVTATDPDERMPPVDSAKSLTDDQRELLVRWVREGAAFDTHWAFDPPQPVMPPRHGGDRWSNNAIDRFVFERLSSAGLRPNPPADRATLVRRLTLDLTGIPPTPKEVSEFVQDNDAGATSRLVDRLMASPRYGEQMALPWLEAARYADTDGYQNDRYRYQHVWRDWVIEAFNTGMPYDQFIIEQIAGDLLEDATMRQQIATGFGRNHRINSEDGSIPQEWLTENVADRVDTFGTVFLGLTIGCARCHDHKYDPITQREYYQLFAYFNNVAEWGVGPNNGNSPPFIEVPANWPDLTSAQDRRAEPEPLKLRAARKEAGNGLRRPQAGSPDTVMVMHELPEPRETFVLIRGQYNTPDRSARVFPDVPLSLRGSIETPPGDRLALARWLVRPDHPLTARVAVNRVWQQFFGAGLVETSENFGSQGALPTHPELLDWLALELVRNDWDLRSIQRAIVLSATYQQSAVEGSESRRKDPANRMLSRAPRRRLPAFVLRDQALAASGLLAEVIGGPSAKPYMPPKIWSSISNNKYQQDHGANLFRRSLYTYWRRTIPPPTMMNFNAAAREVCTVRTEPTNTPLQALTLMNNVVFVEASRFLAERMLKEGGKTVERKIRHGFRLVAGRDATPREAAVLVDAYRQFLRQYKEDLPAARALLAVGETPRDRKLPPDSHAAMTMTASLIFNLDESINRE